MSDSRGFHICQISFHSLAAGCLHLTHDPEHMRFPVCVFTVMGGEPTTVFSAVSLSLLRFSALPQ